MDASVDDDGLHMHISLLGFTLTVGQDAPLAGAVGLAGELSASVPEGFDLMGFEMQANGFVDKTAYGEALLTCSIGTSTYSREWPRDPKFHSPSSSRANKGRPDGDAAPPAEFIATCFMPDHNPANFEDPLTHPPLAPFPITLGMQARCRTADESVIMTVEFLDVLLTRSS